MKDKIPLILIHSGDSYYLPATLLQLKHSNPFAEIYLLGDTANQHYRGLVNHELMTDFFSRASAFRKIYIHFSSNGYEYELICIQRWLVLYEFMIAKGFDQCVYLDSDVLAYSNLNEAQKKIADYGMTVAGISAHINFVNSRATLEKFCGFITAFYSIESAQEKLADRYQKFREGHASGGISDMTLFSDFRKLYPDEILDLAEVRENSVFDIALNNTVGYEEDTNRRYRKGTTRKYKRVSWVNGKPFAFRLNDTQPILLHIIHVQGKCKPDVHSFLALTLSGRLKLYFWRARYYWGRLKGKLFK